MATEATVRSKAEAYRKLFAYVQTLPLEDRWSYGLELKAAKAAFYAEAEEFKCFRNQ